MKLREDNGYFIDGNNNKWSKYLFTRETALKASKTLTNCFNCVDCKYCDNCNSCSDCNFCHYCADCKRCKNCIHCYNCKNCFNCRGCRDLTDYYFCANLSNNEPDNETELDKTLKERGEDYGDYKEVSKVTFDLFKIIENASGFKNFSDDDKLSFFMVFNKIARCVCGKIKYDSLLDIQGYIELIKGKYKD